MYLLIRAECRVKRGDEQNGDGYYEEHSQILFYAQDKERRYYENRNCDKVGNRGYGRGAYHIQIYLVSVAYQYDEYGKAHDDEA